MTLRLAYLTQGKLFLKNGDSAEQQIESQFGQDVIKRDLERQQKNQWKSTGQGAIFSRGALWGADRSETGTSPVQITAVTRGDNPGELFYVLDTGAVGGLFRYDSINDKELRVFHREGTRIRDLQRHPELDLVACSQYFQNGTASISICEKNDLRAVTEGDVIDEAPSWVPGKKKKLLFQSAGIARNIQGLAVGVGPVAAHQLDLENGQLQTLLEADKFDYLLPRMTDAGDLYFIRRPYDALGRSQYPITSILKDALLFPFRLCRALFHFLNVFSIAFSKKPLTTAGGPKLQDLDVKTIMLRGKAIDAEKVIREAGKNNEAPSLVPSSWELVKKSTGGEERVLAKGVVGFDLAGDGEIIYTNGTAIYKLDANGGKTLLLKGKLIDSLAVL